MLQPLEVVKNLPSPHTKPHANLKQLFPIKFQIFFNISVSPVLHKENSGFQLNQ